MEEQPASGVEATASVSLPTIKSTALAVGAANSRLQRWFYLALGFAVLVVSLLAGEQVKAWLHLSIPGNVLGLFILLLCFRLRLIPPELIKEASNRLLFVLPALFIPIYVSAIGGGQLWSKTSYVLLPTLLVATATLWTFVGHLAQHLLRRSCQNE
jgi:holin-like protein